MKTVNIGALRNNLSSYLRDVRNGEEVLVKDREKPIARIVPVRATNVTEQDAELVAKGILKLPAEEMDWDAFWALPRPKATEKAMEEAIRWAKGER